MTVNFCLDAVEAAIRGYSAPEILNTDQKSLFLGTAFIELVQQHGIQISMDGKGYWRNYVFVEHLWKILKYEEVYLHTHKKQFFLSNFSGPPLSQILGALS